MHKFLAVPLITFLLFCASCGHKKPLILPEPEAQKSLQE